MICETGWGLSRDRIRLGTMALLLILVIGAVASQPAVLADSAIPPTSDIVPEDFERGTLDAWRKASESDLSLVPGGGRHRSTGLSVTVGQQESYLYQTDVARTEEGYLAFWFNPNGVSIPNQGTSWIPGKSIRIASVKGSEQWHALVALRVHRPAGQGYKAYLEWHADEGIRYDYESGEFDLVDGWQKITLGFRVDEWVAVWLNDVLVRQVSGVAHEEVHGEIIEIGNTNSTSSIAPAGALRYDNVAFQVPRIDDLWVDAVHGDDGDDGLTATGAFRTIQRAADRAGPGTTVHIMPGVYRETVWPAISGSAAEPALYHAENGPGTAIIRGSEPSRSLIWTQLAADPIGLPPGVDPTNLYYADLSAWDLEDPPRFVVELNGRGQVRARLPLAREPDWQVSTEWKHHEFWWAADGGSDVAGCDPPTDPDPKNCDRPWRSTTQLTDRTSDTGPPGIELGNLTTLGDLTGATLVAIDTQQGHYAYRRTIVAHDVSAGRVTVDEVCEHGFGSGDPGLGWGSKYYVEGRPYLLDTPGEWWYDEGSRRLYLWPRTAGDPATLNIEISRRDTGFALSARSYVALDGLTLEFFNESAVSQANSRGSKSYDNTVRNVILRYANRGIYLGQSADGPADYVTDGFTLERSEVAHMDSQAMFLNYWWGNGLPPDSFTHAGIVDTVIRENELHHLGFRSDGDNAFGAVFHHADRLRFEGNHVHHIAHNGIQFDKSVIQSPKEWGFSPGEIKTGGILIKDNIFEKACQLTTDCGALKFWGRPPDGHVFRDVLITGNVFRNTFGWTHVAEQRGLWSEGTGSDIQGMGGHGLYVDMASGIHAYRNIAYNNAFTGFLLAGVWRDGDVVYYNNLAANSLHGFLLGGVDFDTHGNVNTQMVNNILLNNEGYGFRISDADGDYGDLLVDHNLYHGNGWRSPETGGAWKPGAMVINRAAKPNVYHQTLTDIQAHTPWEAHGVQGDPGLWAYDPDDHDLHDGSWPDFHITADSVNAVDRGTADLPASLTRLLTVFGIDDVRFGSALDIGRYEAPGVTATPAMQFIKPGDTAQFVLSSYPPSFPDSLTLSASSPSSDLTLDLSSSVLNPGESVTLAVVDRHDAATPIIPALPYTITVAATHDEATQYTDFRLYVGSVRVYLPLVLKQGR